MTYSERELEFTFAKNDISVNMTKPEQIHSIKIQETNKPYVCVEKQFSHLLATTLPGNPNRS